MDNLKKDSLKKKYIFKFLTNFVGLAFGFISQTIISRGLGPKLYGDFNFLSNFFTEFVNFFDMGSSTGFYTKLSHRQKESGLVSFYLYFSAAVSLIIVAFVSVTHSTSIYIKIWPNQNIFYIYLAGFLGVLGWFVQQVLSNMLDAYGITVQAEKIKIFQKFFAVILVCILFISKQLNLANFFYYNYAILLFLSIAFIRMMRKGGYSFSGVLQLSFGKIKKYINEFYHYSHPLFIYALVGLIVGIFDRWLLQIYGGSVQQGFFGLSQQIGVFCFLFTSAMTPLIMREFSIAHNNRDITLIANLFSKYIPLFYSITAFISCFMAVNANKVAIIMGGGKFKEAALVVAIMSFYPIHQTYGQLSGSLFLATEQTKLYRNIGVLFMVIGLPVTYFLIAPPEKMGLNIGAMGLAIKTVILQFIAVNVQLYFNSKFLRLSFWKYFWHQLSVVMIMVVVAAITVFLVDKGFMMQEKIISGFLLAGLLYSAIIMIFAYCAPDIFGVKKEEIKNMLRFQY